jgi:hypothetical protein
MRWPWVSRSTYCAVLEAKNEVILYQREHIRELRELLTRPISVTVKLPDDFAVLQPAFIRARSGEKRVKPEKSLPTINWEELDPDNNAQIAEIAARELGPGPHNVFVLSRKVADIQRHIRQARVQRKSRSVEAGTVGTLNPTFKTKVAAEVDEDIDESGIPAEIRERIELASKGR